VICQQCGTENANTNVVCLKCRHTLRSEATKGVITCKNHGNRQATTVCEQCLRPICDECTVIQGKRTLCIEDASVDISSDEEERIEQLAIGDPVVALHAGLTTRIISFVIDAIILLILGGVLASLYWLITGVPPAGLGIGHTNTWQIVLYFVIYALLIFVYSVALTASEGQTFGKQAMQIAVVEKDGTTPSIGTACVRTLSSFISIICLGAGFFAILHDPQKQAWHDRWSNTYVISLDEATERL